MTDKIFNPYWNQVVYTTLCSMMVVLQQGRLRAFVVPGRALEPGTYLFFQDV